MEILISSLFLAGVLAIPAWYMWLSPMARSTNELKRLNKLTKPFAEEKKSPQVLLTELQSQRWAYHQDKADLFISICKAYLTN